LNNKIKKYGKTNISIILPVHELNEETKFYFKRNFAVIEQTAPDELVIVVPAASDVAT
jgi:hypothetical protein